MQRCLYLLFQNQSPTLCRPLFSENYLNRYCHILSIINYHISMDFQGLYISRAFLEFSLKLVYFTMVAEKFKIYSVKTTANTSVSQKIESVQFYSCPHAKLSPKFWSLSPRQTRITNSTWTAFSEDIFSWIESGGEGYIVEEIIKINKGIGHKFW